MIDKTKLNLWIDQLSLDEQNTVFDFVDYLVHRNARIEVEAFYDTIPKSMNHGATKKSVNWRKIQVGWSWRNLSKTYRNVVSLQTKSSSANNLIKCRNEYWQENQGATG